MSSATNTPTLAAPPSWRSLWLRATLRPTLASYQAVAAQAGDAAPAWRWLLGSGLAAGLILSVVPRLFTSVPEAGLALAVPAFAVIAALSWAAFTGCAHGVARLLRGAGAYRELVYVCAAFSAPLMVVASLLSLVPYATIPRAALYLYWLVLYLVAVRAVYRVSRVRAAAAVLLSLVAVTALMLGLGILLVFPWS